MRESTSSDEQIDTSDELIDTHCFNVDLISDAPGPSGSRQKAAEEEGRARQLIQDAEASKARMYGTPGNNTVVNVNTGMSEMHDIMEQFLNNMRVHQASLQQHSAQVDENYLVVGAHLDKSLIEKIINNEYVNFARLLPKDRAVVKDEDHRLEIVNKGGFTYFVLVSDRECGSISGFHKWEQAFRIFSQVYTGQFPHKLSKLIQYNHIIFTAAQTYLWDNVYQYDKEFRIHISNYPQHSWAVILQQAWSMYLKDRI